MHQTRPLAFVTDEHLLDEVLKLAAAADTELQCVPDVAEARLTWSKAPVVLLDEAAAEQCATITLPRRTAVYLVTTAPVDDMWKPAFRAGAEKILRLPGAEPWLIDALADATEPPPPTTGRAVAVIGARGGAGASVFAAALGLTALRTGNNALLIDCDPQAGGLDLVLGAELRQGLRWPDVHLREGRVAASSLHDSLPSRTRGRTRLTVLSGARKGSSPAPEAVAAVLEAGKRTGDTVICDLPRTLDPASEAALTRADLTVMVVPCELRACIAAGLLAERLRALGTEPQLIVRGPAPGGLTPAHLAKAIKHPVLTTMRPEPLLPELLDEGRFDPRPRGPLSRAARATLTALTATPPRPTS